MSPRYLLPLLLLLVACSSEPIDAPPVVDAGTVEDAGEAPDAGCPDGQHLCSTGCVPDDAVTSCGISCTPCPAGANEEATCENGQCGVRCINDTRLCGDACVSESEQACGASCEVCSAPAHAFGYCEEGACQTACVGDYLACDDGTCGHLQAGSCEVGDDCCTGFCEGRACCSGVGSQCAEASDCTTYKCSTAPNMQCQAGKCCVPSGTSCTQNSDCCSGQCEETLVLGKACKN